MSDALTTDPYDVCPICTVNQKLVIEGECEDCRATTPWRSDQDTYKQRCIDAAVILAKWSLYFDLSGAKPVSGDLRDNPVLALLQDTREWLKRPLPGNSQ